MTAQTQPVSYVKSHLAQVIDAVRGGGGPYLVTQKGRAAAVIEDAESYQRTQDALAMLKLVAIAKHSVATGKTYTHKQVFAEARARLKARLAEQA
jgi:prevent-host-death family protein